VVLRREEALREERQGGRRARCAEVVDRPGEALVDEDGDRGCAAALIGGQDVLDSRAGTDVAQRRRAPLELGDRAESGGGERVREPHACENSTSSSSRTRASPE